MRSSITKVRRVLEVLANLAIIIVAIVVIRNLVYKSQQNRQIEKPTVGSRVSLPGVQWNADTTVVLALRKGCKYCEESASFYRRLYDQRSGSEPRMLAVIPGDREGVAAYLSESGIIVDDIINAPLSEVHVSATPTVFLVNRSGIVTNVWVGKLDEHEEAEVTQQIFRRQ